jgi:peptidoglycan/xylan/chitin deacetylase (PgdA/CDA1 family)
MPDWSWRRVHRVVGLEQKAVVLTLDVGARLSNLEKVLDILRDEQVHATVFLYTAELERSPKGPEMVRRMVAEGHELANHTHSHKDLTTFDDRGVEDELEGVERFVREATNGAVSTHPYFREPMLATDDRVDAIEKRLCYRSIWFTVDVGDYVPKVTHETIVKNVLEKKGKPRKIENGSIFIFHGSQPENLVALPTVIHALRADGFAFMTLSEALSASASSARGETSP